MWTFFVEAGPSRKRYCSSPLLSLNTAPTHPCDTPNRRENCLNYHVLRGYSSSANVGRIDQIHHDLDQIDQIDDDLDHLVPALLLCDVVQDLYSTDPTRESRPRSCRLIYGFNVVT